jgi:hypothetical protein
MMSSGSGDERALVAEHPEALRNGQLFQRRLQRPSWGASGQEGVRQLTLAIWWSVIA